MTSSNLVRVALIKEDTYGVTPVAGDFSTARFTSENLSGTPDTTESQQIRIDRMSSGTVVTGLTVGGSLNFELAKEEIFEELMSSALLSEWETSVAVNVKLGINTATKTITRSAGDFTTLLAVGDMLTLSGFLNAANNTQVMITEVTNATNIKFTGPGTMVTEEIKDDWVTDTLYPVGSYVVESNKIYECLIEHTSDADFSLDLAASRWEEVSVGTAYKLCDYLVIGTDYKSFSIEKKFIELTNKAIVYRGMLVSEMTLNIAHGSIINGTLNLSGNDYRPVETAGEHITNDRTITAAATTNSFNGSVDMPFIASSAAGVFDKADFCFQSVNLTLNNNFTPQNCIGLIAPKGYSAGTANITTSLSAYLADENWSILGKKLSQEPFSVGFAVKNLEGYYGFFLPAVQVSFEDPSSVGANQDVMLTMEGTAKVGDNGISAIKIFRA